MVVVPLHWWVLLYNLIILLALKHELNLDLGLGTLLLNLYLYIVLIRCNMKTG